MIKSAARSARRGQNRPLFRCFPLFIPISKVLSPGLFQSFPETDQSLSPPLALPRSAIRGLWSSHCLSVLTQRLQSSVISGLCHVRVRACRGGVRLFMEIEEGYMFSHLPFLAQFTRTQTPEHQVLHRKISSCPLGAQRGNLLCWVGHRKREPVYHNVNSTELGN